MMGGLTIDSKRTARAIEAFPEMEGESLRVGRHVELPPCLPEPILAAFSMKEGRKCPRVELRPDNREVADLFAIVTCEDTRPLARDWIKHNLTGLGEEEAARVINRTVVARLSPKVSALYRQPEEPGKES